MDSHDERRAVVNVGHELERRGWTLFGYHKDESDIMTDYFHPASWDGVATHPSRPGVVVCVRAWAKDRSGRHETEQVAIETGLCPKCGGTGEWPGGLTYQEARENPAKQHWLDYIAETSQGRGLALLPSVVSPVHYINYGRPKCLYCSGDGHTYRYEDRETGVVWPTFQSTPKGRAWHVEVAGKIVASGTGLNRCANWNDRAGEATGVKALVDDIEAAADRAGRSGTTAPPPSDPSAPGAPGTFEVKHERDWTWLTFSGKPDEAVREALKSTFGARFSGKRMAWYITQHVGRAEIEAAIAGDRKRLAELQAARYEQAAIQAMERACGIA